MFSIVASLHVLLRVNRKKLLQSTPSEDWLLIRENTNMEINYKDSRTKNMFLVTKKICQNISQVHKSMFVQVSIPLIPITISIPQFLKSASSHLCALKNLEEKELESLNLKGNLDRNFRSQSYGRMIGCVSFRDL